MLVEELRDGDAREDQRRGLGVRQRGGFLRHLMERDADELREGAAEGGHRAEHLVADGEAAVRRRAVHDPAQVEPRDRAVQRAPRERAQERGELVPDDALRVDRVDAARPDAHEKRVARGSGGRRAGHHAHALDRGAVVHRRAHRERWTRRTRGARSAASCEPSDDDDDADESRGGLVSIVVDGGATHL